MDNLVMYILLIFLAVILISNIIATYVIFNTYFEIKERRIYQTLLVWLVPIIGSTLVIYINCENYFNEKKERQIGNNTNISDSEAIHHAMGANHRGGR